MFRLLRASTLVEKILLAIFSLVLIVSVFQIGGKFYSDNSTPVPGRGGTHVEGVVDTVRFLNPLITQTGLDRDVTSLIFCGLTHFDPISNTIVDDAADHTLSENKKTYTFRLREDLTWHDGTPVTADDIIFTFETMLQAKDFPNPALAADFRDVALEKLDDRTVTMTLKNRYAFFIYNTTLGLLPQHLLKDTPPADLTADPYNLNPIGCGPYKLDSINGSQVRLSAFANYFRGRPHLDSIIFRLFDSEDQLFRNLDGVTGTKDLPNSKISGLKNDARLALYDFNLPQYVALFFNVERPILANPKTRLGLQLATNKNKLVTEIGGRTKVIDTPLLEIDTANWKYEFSAERADGALFDAGWKYRTATQPTTNLPTGQAGNRQPTTANSKLKFITTPASERYFATDKTDFFLEGTAPASATAIFVNDYKLQKFTPGSTTWSFRSATVINTLREGENEYILSAKIEGAKKELERTTIFFSADAVKREEWLKQKTTPESSTIATTEPSATPTPTKPATKPEPFRYDDAGQILTLKILVSDNYPEFVKVGELVTKEWQERGVKAVLEKVDNAIFFERLKKHDYDIVLFGQNLGYNLDTYQFWHSSEAREDGSNLSNLKSSAVNAWLEQARASFDASERQKKLVNLRAAIDQEVPAIFLYTPTYTYAIDKKIKSFNLGRIALKRDRLAGASGWYLREERALKNNVGVWAFMGWLWKNL